MAGKFQAALGFVAVTAANAAGTLSLAWNDCGDSSTHGKVTGLTPSTLTLGEKTRAVGTGTFDEAVTAGTFTIDMQAGIIKEHWTGDICAAKTFNLPLGTGSLTWDGFSSCPLAAGNVSVPIDILLSSSIPSALARATINITATSSNGDKLLCMSLTTSPTAVLETPNDACPWATRCVNSEKVCQVCNQSPFKGDNRCVCGPAQADWMTESQCKKCEAPAPAPGPSPATPCSWAAKCVNSEKVCQACFSSPFQGDDRCVCGPNKEDWIKKGECQACGQELEVAPAVNSGTLSLNWKDCGDASTHGKVQSLTPATLVLGQQTHAVGTGTLDEAVPGGSYNIDVKAGLITEHWNGDIATAKTFTLPLGTGSISWNGLKTPLAQGSISVPLDILLSSHIPSALASATITMTATATNGDKLLCMEIDTKPVTENFEVVV